MYVLLEYIVYILFFSAIVVVKTSEDVFDVAEALQPNTTGKIFVVRLLTQCL